MSTAETASAIVALINSKPASPTQTEIEAIIRKVVLSGTASMTAIFPAHAENYCEWRRLMETHVREFEKRNETGKTKAEIEDEEARLREHLEVIDALINRIFAVPARTWGDVMLYAQVCFWRHWDSDPEGSDAQSRLEWSPTSQGEGLDLALAKLLEAIFTVAGVSQFAAYRGASVLPR